MAPLISQAKKEANQRNAARSTGPRSPSGKQTSSRNSRRHGLATDILNDPVWSSEVYKLAKVFIPKEVRPEVDRALRTLLAAMMEVMRVQAARTELWTLAMARRSMCKQEDGEIGPKDLTASTVEPGTPVFCDVEAMVALEALPTLIKLDRYQRRAEGCCRRVLRDLGPISM